jgi:hypothetical protein
VCGKELVDADIHHFTIGTLQLDPPVSLLTLLVGVCHLYTKIEDEVKKVSHLRGAIWYQVVDAYELEFGTQVNQAKANGLVFEREDMEVEVPVVGSAGYEV